MKVSSLHSDSLILKSNLTMMMQCSLSVIHAYMQFCMTQSL